MEDVERRVAHEEALHTDAQFGPSAMDIGMQLESEEYDRWRAWAGKEADIIQQRQASMYTGTETGATEEGPREELELLEEDAIGESAGQGGPRPTENTEQQQRSIS